VIQWKLTLLERAFQHFKHQPHRKSKDELSRFQAREASWLEDFALFMAIKESQGMVSWENWPKPLRSRDPQALKEFRLKNPDADPAPYFPPVPFLPAVAKSTRICQPARASISLEIFPSLSLTTARMPGRTRELFYMDEEGKPIFVAGVPPDYFSPTGQLWGNPIYKWEVHQQTGYAWWIERIRSTFQLVDFLRLDHFRGFAGYWEIPAGMETAEVGRWAPGPGISLFEAIRDALQALPIIAEDLGEITPDVIELRDTLGLPGMKILQFAFQNTRRSLLTT
jgi:4-alpha-glucanotransferase